MARETAVQQTDARAAAVNDVYYCCGGAAAAAADGADDDENGAQRHSAWKAMAGPIVMAVVVVDVPAADVTWSGRVGVKQFG